jgi:hypothetical protein
LPAGTNYNHGDTSYLINCWQVINPPYLAVLDLSDGTNIVPVPTEITTADGLTLDTQSPYGFFSYPLANDSPGVRTDIPYETGASISQNSTMWLMFKPDGGHYVPLRSVNWYFSGSATNPGTGWILTGSNWSTNPPDVDTGTNYPTWTNNSHYYGIGP